MIKIVHLVRLRHVSALRYLHTILKVVATVHSGNSKQ